VVVDRIENPGFYMLHVANDLDIEQIWSL